jgi:hypothetical protein
MNVGSAINGKRLRLQIVASQQIVGGDETGRKPAEALEVENRDKNSACTTQAESVGLRQGSRSPALSTDNARQ